MTTTPERLPVATPMLAHGQRSHHERMVRWSVVASQRP
jgi:hypothetical protein